MMPSIPLKYIMLGDLSVTVCCIWMVLHVTRFSLMPKFAYFIPKHKLGCKSWLEVLLSLGCRRSIGCTCRYHVRSTLGFFETPGTLLENSYWKPWCTYLLLAECEVLTASYGPSFFLPFMAQARSVQAMKTRKEKTRIHNLPYGPSKRG